MRAGLVVVESETSVRRTVVGSARSQDELKRVLEKAKNYDGVYYLIDGKNRYNCSPKGCKKSLW